MSDTSMLPFETRQPPKRADIEFEIEIFTPAQARRCYPQQTPSIDAARTTHYAALTTPTPRGEFLCIIPLDGTLVPGTPEITRYLVQIAQEELARAWDEAA
jgi:hypothetical protein